MSYQVQNINFLNIFRLKRDRSSTTYSAQLVKNILGSVRKYNRVIETYDSCGNQFDKTAISSFFITLNFTSQLESALKDPDVTNNIDYRFSRQKKNNEALEDIYDGDIYKKYAS